MSWLRAATSNLEERRRRRVTHIEGTRPPGSTPGLDGSGPGGPGGSEGPGPIMPIGDVGPVLPTAFDAPDYGDADPFDPQGLRKRSDPNEDPQLRVWSTFKMFEDEELQRQHDILEMLKRLREAAQLDENRVRDWLNANPETASKLEKAIESVASASGAKGWNRSAAREMGPVDDGQGGLFL